MGLVAMGTFAASGDAQASTPQAGSPVITSTSPGATPFIAWVTVSSIPAQKLKSITFTVENKPGATTMEVSATYATRYLADQGFFTTPTRRSAQIPVYGLYQNYSNTVDLSVVTSLSTTSLSTSITTGVWGATTPWTSFTTRVARQQSVSLPYSFMLLKEWQDGTSPVIMDTDGNVRWVGTCGIGSQASALDRNNIYIGIPGSATLYENQFDGTCSHVANYSASPYNVWNIAHHNIDVTSKGMLIDVNATHAVESRILDVKTTGAVVKQFTLGNILSKYLRTHGDTPSGFVFTTTDVTWFHNNASTYWPAKNELVVSSRENFVIGINWTTDSIDWILGTESKRWYVDYPALRPLAITLTSNGLYPIGQHAVSIDTNGNLMLFDDGLQSSWQNPPGLTRSYSAASSYSINPSKHTGKMVWNYTHTENILSQICSSVYEFSHSYLLDYAAATGYSVSRLIGINASGTIAFDYALPGAYPSSWNAVPLNLAKMTYSS